MTVCRISPQIRATITAPQIYISGDQYYSNLFAGCCGINLPVLRYNKIIHKWQFSHDGTNYYIFGSGGGSGSGDNSTKVVEILNSPIIAEVSHVLPGGFSYTLASGSKLDVFMNGQILVHDQLTKICDYKEINVNTIKFNFAVPKGTALTYIIK